MQLQKNKLKILFLYNGTQLFTQTVSNHINSFAKYSNHSIFFLHHDIYLTHDINFEIFDCIGIHYTIRIPYDHQLSSAVYEKIKNFNKLKFLFIQDEYDNVLLTKKKIKELKINLIFTVVPEKNIEVIYPKKEFPNTKFINTLTGYVPLDQKLDLEIKPPSLRPIFCGYRGRKLPIKYGELGFDKVRIAEIVKSYCQKNFLSCDIEIAEENRIYNQDWYKFLLQCRSVLGTESGSNIFDFNGSLDIFIENFTYTNPDLSSDDIYKKIVEPLENKNFMNQISPKIFEAIKYRCALVLFEGNYSGIIKPEKHYIPLKKDGSNIEDVFRLLKDDSYVNSMTDQAYRDIIDSEKFSYDSFVKNIDSIVKQNYEDLKIPKNSYLLSFSILNEDFYTVPKFIEKKLNFRIYNKEFSIKNLEKNKFMYLIWKLIPSKIKIYIKKLLLK